MEKQSALSQIPGLTYRPEALANLPKPAQWNEHKLSDATRQSIVIRAVGTATYDPNLPESIDDMVKESDAKLHTLYKYCESNDVFSPSDFEMLPKEFKSLTNDNKLVP